MSGLVLWRVEMRDHGAIRAVVYVYATTEEQAVAEAAAEWMDHGVNEFNATKAQLGRLP